jgi:hypothetical protein
VGDERHELHRAVDGDWDRSEPDRAADRRALVVLAVGIAATTASVVALALLPALPPGVGATIAALPLVAVGIAAASA